MEQNAKLVNNQAAILLQHKIKREREAVAKAKAEAEKKRLKKPKEGKGKGKGTRFCPPLDSYTCVILT